MFVGVEVGTDIDVGGGGDGGGNGGVWDALHTPNLSDVDHHSRLLCCRSDIQRF